MRFKPPSVHEECFWRVEFRTMDVQPSSFETASFSLFVVILSRAIVRSVLAPKKKLNHKNILALIISVPKHFKMRWLRVKSRLKFWILAKIYRYWNSFWVQMKGLFTWELQNKHEINNRQKFPISNWRSHFTNEPTNRNTPRNTFVKRCFLL